MYTHSMEEFLYHSSGAEILAVGTMGLIKEMYYSVPTTDIRTVHTNVD